MGINIITILSTSGPSATSTASGCFIDPGYLHFAILTGLTPRSSYFYCVSDGVHWSPINSFLASPKIVRMKFMMYIYLYYVTNGMLSIGVSSSRLVAKLQIIDHSNL